MFLDVSEVKPQTMAGVPAGKYSAAVIEAEVKDTKNGTGQYVATTFRITQGEMEGRKVFHNFNIKNQNPDAQRIGLEQIKILCDNAGHSGKLNSVTDLVGLNVGICTKVKEDPAYGPRTEISYFFKKEAHQDQSTPF